MKLLHLADLHLGRRVGEFDLLEDQRYFLSRIPPLCAQEKVDAVLIAGDVYDKSIPPADAVALLDGFLTALADAGLAVFVIAGNHDSGERLGFGSRLLESRGLHIAGSYTGQLPCTVLQDACGPVAIWSLPFVRASTAAHFLPDADASDYDRALGAVLAAAPVDTAGRNVLLAHQFVTAAGQDTQPDGSESAAVSVGTVDNVDVRRFDAFDYVALGHIHRPQAVGRAAVRYAGSPLKYSLDECLSQKSVTLVTLGAKGDVRIETRAIAPLHDMRHITGPMARLLDPANVETPDDYMWVTLTDDTPILDAMSRIRAVYPNTMKLDYDNRLTAAQRSAQAAQDVRQKGFAELFRDFYTQVTGSAPSDAEWEAVRTLYEQGEEDVQ
jgi:exonuclease SbcD